MTSFFVNNASCWRRLLNNDDYEEEAEWLQMRNNNVDHDSFLLHVIGKFKHEVYAYALGRSPYDVSNTKSIYLYVSGFRYIKCHYCWESNTLKVEVRNESVAEYFRQSFERLANGRFPKLKREFKDDFTYLQYYPCGYYQWGYFLYKHKAKSLKRI